MITEEYTLKIKGNLLKVDKPMVMGILNLTPDSFFPGSRSTVIEDVVEKVGKMISHGAEIIDLGAQSTRPGATLLSEKEELERLDGVVKAILFQYPEVIISIDTFYSNVARKSIEEGAAMVNDVSAGMMDKAMFETITELSVPYILMHHNGIPATKIPGDDGDKTGEVIRFFSEKINELRKLGVADIVLDPGFGFGKNSEQNLLLLNAFRQFTIFGIPVLAGLSRKKTIQQILETDAEGALNGTTVMNTIALMHGAAILRVHDVKQAVEAVKLFTAMKLVSGKNSGNRTANDSKVSAK